LKSPHALDVVPPDHIAILVENVGIRKIGLSLTQTLALGILAGAFIAFGAMLFTVTITGSELGFGPTRVLGGLAFSLGLVLVIVGGAELFTGNSLIVLAYMDQRITAADVVRNWSIVYVANLIGALGAAILVHLSGTLELADGAVQQTARSIAEAKISLGFMPALTRGILCNILVCLAVWMCFAARSIAGKVAVIVFPITAFVALGFEHSVANMYLIPIAAMQPGSTITTVDFLTNLIPVTIGNVIGGGVLVAVTYWLVYLKKS
jgi:formate/nitrite transporter